MARRGWGLVVLAAVGLALVSLASNVTTVSQLSGEANTLLVVRSTLSKLVNAGTVWAGLGILSGWLVRRPFQAAVAGTAAGLLALVTHYGVGVLLGSSRRATSPTTRAGSSPQRSWEGRSAWSGRPRVARTGGAWWRGWWSPSRPSPSHWWRGRSPTRR